MKKITVSCLLFCMATICHAEEKGTRTPREVYEGTVFYGQTMCNFAISIARNLAAMGKPQDESSDWKGCIKGHKVELKKAYDGFSRTVKKPLAKAALKEHFVLATTALNGIEPATEELQIVYDKRQADNKAKVSEQWTRFEVEN